MFLWSAQERRQGPLVRYGTWYYLDLASFSSALSETGLSSFSVSPFSAGQSSLFLDSHFSLFSLCSPFPLCLHLSEDWSFSATLSGFVYTFAEVYLAGNVANIPLEPSFAIPLTELTLLLGIVSAGQAHAFACWPLWCTIHREPSRSWPAHR